MTAALYFEDFTPGQQFDLGSYDMTADEIVSFGRQFDPQPMHTSDGDSRFGGLIASGWHTTAVGMRLLVEGILHRTENLGSPGCDHIRWLHPVRPGDRLHGTAQVKSVRKSRSRAGWGIVELQVSLAVDSGDLVATWSVVGLIKRSPLGANNKEEAS